MIYKFLLVEHENYMYDWETKPKIEISIEASTLCNAYFEHKEKFENYRIVSVSFNGITKEFSWKLMSDRRNYNERFFWDNFYERIPQRNPWFLSGELYLRENYGGFSSDIFEEYDDLKKFKILSILENPIIFNPNAIKPSKKYYSKEKRVTFFKPGIFSSNEEKRIEEFKLFIDFLNLDPVRVFTSHWIQDCKHVMPDDYEFVYSDEENRPDIFTSLKDDYKNHEEAYFNLLHAYRDIRKGYEHLPFELLADRIARGTYISQGENSLDENLKKIDVN